MREMWLRAWSSAAVGANVPCTCLIEALLMLPASAAIVPPSWELAEVLRRALLQGSPTLSLLERIADAADTRLQDAEPLDRGRLEDLRCALDHLEVGYKAAFISLLGSISDDGGAVARAAPLLGRLLRASRFHLDAASAASASAPVVGSGAAGAAHVHGEVGEAPWKGWHQRPTIGWLTKGDWLEVNVHTAALSISMPRRQTFLWFRHRLSEIAIRRWRSTLRLFSGS
jgi:hypothetical protein